MAVRTLGAPRSDELGVEERRRWQVDLRLEIGLAAGYKSPSQVARVITEHWAATNLFCLACTSSSVEALQANTRVQDYRCPNCTSHYQLKSQRSAFGNAVTNSAYEPKMEAIREGQAPHYAFLRYSPQTWTVTDLFVIPGYFFTHAVVSRRPPLPPTARRAGWVGSHILLGSLPPDARVSVVSDGQAVPAEDVRTAWTRFAFLGDAESVKGGWGADTLMCVRRLQRTRSAVDFSLREFYTAFEEQLASLHPENRNVRAKIRQQLQILRDHGVLGFLGRGRYRVVR